MLFLYFVIYKKKLIKKLIINYNKNKIHNNNILKNE